MSAVELKSTTAAQEVRILQQIIETISYNTDLDNTLKQIIDVVDGVAHATEIFIYLPKGNTLFLRAAKSKNTDTLQSITLPIGTGITGWVAEHKKRVVLSEKAYQDSRFHLFSGLPADQYEAFLSLPMIFQKKIIGVLNIQHKNSHTFTKRELQLLETIARATAGAIEHARLFEENMVLSETLEARKVIDRAKGKLMKHYKMSETEAYDWLKKRAMDLRKSMKDVAEAILISMN